MDRLSKEEVLHVAYLARINLDEDEIEKYRVQLKKLMDDIDKIKDVKDYDEEELIFPVDHNINELLREDKEQSMLDYNEAMKNVPHSTGNFVEVPVMLNE